MATAEKTPKIYEAISNVMKDVGIVGKNDSNDFDHYKYRGIDAVMNALNPAMIKHKVFVAPTVLDATREERAGKNGTLMMYTILTVLTNAFENTSAPKGQIPDTSDVVETIMIQTKGMNTALGILDINEEGEIGLSGTYKQVKDGKIIIEE